MNCCSFELRICEVATTESPIFSGINDHKLVAQKRAIKWTRKPTGNIAMYWQGSFTRLLSHRLLHGLWRWLRSKVSKQLLLQKADDEFFNKNWRSLVFFKESLNSSISFFQWESLCYNWKHFYSPVISLVSSSCKRSINFSDGCHRWKLHDPWD